MGKFVFLAVLLAALVAVSLAQGVSEQDFRDAQCRSEVQQKPLHACRQILQHQQTGGEREGAVGISVPQFQSEWDTRERCCRQLQSVSRGCRCSAIRGMVRDYEETMPQLGGGRPRRGSPGEQQAQGCSCGGKTAGHHRQGGGYYGGEGGLGQQGQVLRHETPHHQQEQAGGGFYGPVELMQLRQYVAGLPAVCQIEPMECSVFSADQY